MSFSVSAEIDETQTLQRSPWQCSTCKVCQPSTGSTDAARSDSRGGDCACKVTIDSTTLKQQARKTRLYIRPPLFAVLVSDAQKHISKNRARGKSTNISVGAYRTDGT